MVSGAMLYKRYLNDKFLGICLMTMLVSFIVGLVNAQDLQRKYVRSQDEFNIHTKIHKHNVLLLGMSLYEKYKKTFFKNVSEEILMEKLLLHDYEKTASVEELRRFRYTNESPFYSRLYDFYQKDNLTMTENERVEFDKLRDELGLFEGKYQYLFLKKYNLLEADGITLTDEAERIVFIDRAADLVDRYMSEVALEEFNRDEMKSAHSYYSDRLFQEMILHLEENYHKIVPKNALVLLYQEREQHEKSKACKKYFSL